MLFEDGDIVEAQIPDTDQVVRLLTQSMRRGGCVQLRVASRDGVCATGD